MVKDRTNEHKVKFDISNLIPLLAKSLYPDVEIFVRELIQNATDAITRRCFEDPEFNTESAKITIEITPSENRISFTDTGIGMDLNEAQETLLTIGKSGTGEFRQVVSAANTDAAKQLVGQFGIGFLSAFMVADQVTIISKRWGKNARAVKFSFTEDNSINMMREINDERPYGTTVVLHLTPSSQTFLDVSTIRHLIAKYCNFIEFPIYIAGIADPVNAMEAPWHKDSSEDKYWSFVRRFYAEDALAVFPIKTDTVSGVLYIPRIGPRSYPQGNVSVYVRRIFVHESDQYLPESCRFIRGCLESSDLHWTASRTEVVRDSNFYELKKELAAISYDCLKRFIQRGDEHSIAFLTQYNGLLKAEALRDSQLFGSIYEDILFPTLTKPISISKYLETITAKGMGERPCVYYYTEGTQERRELIEDAIANLDIPILDASLPIDQLILQKLAQAPISLNCHHLSYEVVSLFAKQHGEDWKKFSVQTRNTHGDLVPSQQVMTPTSDTSLNNSLFVMMPFADEFHWVFNDVIAPVGRELGLEVSRMDEESFAGRITDKLEQKIASSSVLLADVTKYNPNVMYELGLAHGLFRKNRTVLIAQDLSNIPFDIKDYVVIGYGTSKEAVHFKDRLLNTIKSILS